MPNRRLAAKLVEAVELVLTEVVDESVATLPVDIEGVDEKCHATPARTTITTRTTARPGIINRLLRVPA